MSDAVNARIGSTTPGHYGAAGSGVTLGEAMIATAWNVQGGAASPSFAEAAQRLAGIALPVTPNTAARGEGVAALWLGPASWLLVAGAPPPLSDFVRARDALNAAGGALFDVSAARVAYVVAGSRANDVLASGCPLDFHPRAFPAGDCRQSLFGRVPALFYRTAEAPGCTVLVARSFAQDVWQTLCSAAMPYGYTVLAPATFA